jgi:hypothetical protein
MVGLLYISARIRMDQLAAEAMVGLIADEYGMAHSAS